MLKHTKRYMVILQTWNYKNYENVRETYSVDEFDTMKEVDYACNLIIDMYFKVKKPSDMNIQIYSQCHYWGYVVLDFERKEIVSICHDGLKDYYGASQCINDYLHLKMMDDIFREDGEIPDGYEWQEGEYEGWLQYRWGDKRNKIQSDKANTQPNITNIEFRPEIKIDADVYIQKIEETKKGNKKKLPPLVKDNE